MLNNAGDNDGDDSHDDEKDDGVVVEYVEDSDVSDDAVQKDDVEDDDHDDDDGDGDDDDDDEHDDHDGADADADDDRDVGNTIEDYLFGILRNHAVLQDLGAYFVWPRAARSGHTEQHVTRATCIFCCNWNSRMSGHMTVASVHTLMVLPCAVEMYVNTTKELFLMETDGKV